MSRGNNRNAEVISLLNKIGERLISFENQNLGLKKSVDQLEVKSNKNEEYSRRLHEKLKVGSIKNQELKEQQQKIKETQQAFLNKIKYLDQLTEKLESTISEQNKINRRLENIVNERAKMLRKIERIEETVLDTQNALEAKAMVLLTDKNVNQNNNIPEKLKTRSPELNTQNANDNGSILSSKILKAGIVSTFAILLFFSMTLMYPQDTLFNQDSDSSSSTLSNLAENITTDVNKYFPENRQAENKTQEQNNLNENLLQNNIQDDSLIKSTATASEEGQSNEVFTELDESRVLAEFEKEPEQLAGQLNQISPALGRTESLESPTENAASENIRTARYAEVPREDFDVSSFLSSQVQTASLSDRIDSDADLPDQIKEIEKQAFNGLPEAQHDLAAIYTAGHAGVPVNYKKAAGWFREAAINGVANARYNLGVLYHQGIGVEQNTNLAINWYKASAELGHPEAQYNLGIAYIEGIGVIFDAHKAARYFEAAAKTGIMEAAYNLGLIHENGLLGDPDYSQAVYWYKASSSYGSEEAVTALSQLAKTLNMSVTELEEKYLPEKEDSQVQSSHNMHAHTKDTSKKSTVRSLSNTDFAEPDETNLQPTTTTKQATIAQIQEQLISIGLFPGPADGVLSPILEDSIRSYQSQYSIEVTGLPSEDLLVHMISTDETKGFGSRE